jgi:prolyl oligopeptidase
MPQLMQSPPYSPADVVKERLHGATVEDSYRWLENQQSARTREWLAAQRQYSRSFLDGITGRDLIRERVRELLDVEVYDSILKAGNRYFFRKRLPGQEQAAIFFREGFDSADQLLIDPAARGSGPHIAVKPVRISAEGRLLLYEVKEGGERTGCFELLDVETRKILPDALPRGYLRSFAFGANSESFYYVHEPLISGAAQRLAAFRHVLGTSFRDDKEIFFAGKSKQLRLQFLSGDGLLGFVVVHFEDKALTDLYLWSMTDGMDPKLLIRSADFKLAPLLLRHDRILAITDFNAPNFRIVELRSRPNGHSDFVEVVKESDSTIQSCFIASELLFVSYVRGVETQVEIFDLAGRRIGRLPTDASDTVRLLRVSEDGDELFFESESFSKPVQICSYSPGSKVKLWAERRLPFSSEQFGHAQVWFTAKDGTPIPMFLVGRKDVLEGGPASTVMTSYGGYGVPMTPQFSVFVLFLMERGCLFALPNIRGGSEFGAEWHKAAKGRNRQVAFDDFLSGAEWLMANGRTDPGRLAIFGGSNSGLLVAAAMTQRPDLFRAVLCMVPLTDMLRYHLFDKADAWKEEFGTAENPQDFIALFSYSPYHNVRDGVGYPATMIVSGDADQNCNALHARKMAARLQAANASPTPILLDYSPHRGHSPVLPLNERIAALTDRLAFVCDQLGLKL